MTAVLPDHIKSEYLTLPVAQQGASTDRATIGCVIPAYNEQDTIAEVLTALLDQTRLPDAIHVVINNSDDETFYIAREFAGPHERVYQDVTYRTEVFVHDIGSNSDKKVGALNFGYTKVADDYDYFLGVDGDTVADRHAVEYLEKEIRSDPRIGGISAIYTVAESSSKGFISKFLTAGQRAQFAAFNMDNLLRGRNMAVLGGQFSILSMDALKNVMIDNRQATPWVKDSEVEDSLLSLQIKNLGYATKISARARAAVGGMDTLRSLDGQQVKWNYGAIDLMWPGQRSNTPGQPLHPNLRLRWSENVSMVFNILTRLSFIMLLAASLSISAWVFYPVWLIPPVVAVILNLRIALTIKGKSARDIAFALLVAPAELYLWLRMGHFLRAWTKFFTNAQTDNWAAQARAERGAGSAYLMPLVVFAVVAAGLIFTWLRLPVDIQSGILAVGWPILYITTMVQTTFMLRKTLRSHRGFHV
ncbi:glycosyltransferase family 2 protein [Arthrobacter agilis]|jgi:cellulose synthase/poly-beta-1,6-N-acetylglucosamine synthase-like glycosyltransferase|uniref:glycosyltransferase family 2 protein n=1 Tax=Arthrobacter agilis TaxID=37921 RepID=UPI002786F848|nr:glycosyltransferase family 2 protein [Arthrobacter agilis]MDQ0734024.1 biofilm PGA synthesis N-glycosyltransferase PgaC [Arthrobacter agilis]